MEPAQPISDPGKSETGVASMSSGASDQRQPVHAKAKLWYVGLVLALLLLGGGAFLAYRWLGAAKTHDRPAYSGPVQKIAVANIGEYSILNLIAKQKGYFVQNGLNAEITEYASGPPAMADLLAGKVDVAVAADFVGVVNIFSHPELRILSQLGSQDNFRIIARKDKGITSAEGLKGKTIGVTKKSAGEFFLGRFLSLHNLGLGDITEVDLAPAAMVTQLTNSQLDAVVTFEPHAYKLQNTLGDAIISWSAQGDERALAVSYTTDALVKDRPETIRRYLASLRDAQNFLRQNDAGARQILATAQNYDPAYVDYIWPKFDFRLSLSQELLLTMEDQARFVMANKLTAAAKVPNYLDYIYFKGLQAVQPEAITIIH